MTEILIVDDELGIRNILSEILADSGYVICTAADANEARERVAQRHFDLVLLDIWMPGTDGLTLLREWRYSGKLNFPVIVMSGHGSIDHAKRAMDDGAIDFIEKPISLKRLLSAIQDGLARWAALQAAKSQNTSDRKRPGRRRSNDRQPEHLPIFEVPAFNFTIDFNRPIRDVLIEIERAYFRIVLSHVDHSMSDLARHAGLERTHLYRKLRALGLDVENMRRDAENATQLPIDEETITVSPVSSLTSTSTEDDERR